MRNFVLDPDSVAPALKVVLEPMQHSSSDSFFASLYSLALISALLKPEERSIMATVVI